ncbi:ABC transporter substrate-binding protein [Nonomuraea jiangxiensis]|uniref:Multiple sugar transport system substrate-binding protein n=1 Tax=Nonomuraea jiangxiensis TaxID=633440 RepID=A0A1G7ZLC6_9ACTN|nr:sugar ABC transporter substrate-binding protein [Nonomuraea jiangxiensis]SDH09488.1 multiple sugar transport system substrate-binding protein [Nonomuraea jiangxiensis]
MEMNRRHLLALAVALPVLAACGDNRQQPQSQTSSVVKSGVPQLDANRPGNDTWPFEEAEALNKSLTWPTTNVPEPASKVTLTVAITSDVVAEVRNAQFDLFFKQRHPNIEIKRETSAFDAYLTKYMAQAAGGKLPDVMYIHYSWAQNFIANDIFQSLDDYIAKTPAFDMADLPQNALGYFKDGAGKLYGLPTDMAPKLLFYNKDVFDAAGVDYPDDSWTFDTMLDMARKLAKGEGAEKVYGFTPMPIPAPDLSTIFLMPYGGGFLSQDEMSVEINKEPARKALGLWLDLLRKDKATPSLAELNQVLEKVEPFKIGKAAMSIQGAWILTELAKQKAFKWGAAPVPKGPAGRFTPAVGSALAMTANSQQKDAAWIYLNEYLSSTGQQFRRISAPARQSAWMPNAEALGIPKDVIEIAQAAMKDYATSDGVMHLPANKKIVDTAKPIWEKAMIGDLTLDQALQQIAEQVTPLLAENKIA